MVSGIGVGVCGFVGGKIGVAMVAGETLSIGGLTLSGTLASAIGIGSAFTSGAAGYGIRTLIDKKEKFEMSDMLVEAGANAASGALSLVGGIAGGITGVHGPGVEKSISNLVKYHGGLTYFGVYPTKVLISKIRSGMQR